MIDKSVLRKLDRELGSRIEVRRHNISSMISESYRTLYSCESGTNMHKLVESHLDDVRKNPSDIERLSRQLAIVKEVKKLTESGELSDKDLEVATNSEYEGDVEEKVAKDREERVAPTEEIKESAEEVCPTCESSPCICESKEEDLLEDTELTDEEVEELTKHLAEIRKNKQKVAEEVKSYQPTKEEASAIVARIQRKFGNEISEQDYLKVIDDVLGVDDVVSTDIIDFEREKAGIKIIDESCETPVNEDISEESDLTKYINFYNTWKHMILDLLQLVWPEQILSTVERKMMEKINDIDNAALKKLGKDMLADIRNMTSNASAPAAEKATESKIHESYSNEITVEDLHDLISTIEDIIEEMESRDMDSIRLQPNTYGISHFVSYPSRGFLDLDNPLGGEDDDDDYYESKTYESLDLSEFRKKSAGKAFIKTFKKLDKQLHEGTALTRQDAISLYKAANSAMTHLSVELEHNPEFLGTFNESVSILSGDVSDLLESMKKGKAPNASTMKSLAKFSEAMLREEDEEEELPPVEDEEDTLTDEEVTSAEDVEAQETEEETPTEASEEEEEFDREYADARIELHKEMTEEHAGDENPAIADKLTQDAEEILDLPGITKEQTAEIEAELEGESPAEDSDELPESAYNGGQAEGGARDTYKRPGGSTSGSGSNHKALDGKRTKKVLAKDIKPGMVTNTGKVLKVTDRGDQMEIGYGYIGNRGSYASDNVSKDLEYDVLDETLDDPEETKKDIPDLDLGDTTEITDDELAELRKHLREMRSDKKVTASKSGRPLKRRA